MSDLNRWETRYGTAEGMLFGEEPNVFLARQAPLLKPGWRALSVADGDGRNGVWLAERGLDVVSVDFSPTGQAKARAWAEARGVSPTFHLADIRKYDWPDASFDLIVVIFAQFVVPSERTAMFAGIRRALKPGGLLLLEGYGPRQLEYATGGPKTLEQLYTRTLLEKAFAGFSKLQIDEYDAELNEGTAHRGPSALVDLVAWK